MGPISRHGGGAAVIAGERTMLRELQQVPSLSLCAATLSVAVVVTVTGCDSSEAEGTKADEGSTATAGEDGGGTEDGGESADSGSSGENGESGNDGASNSGDGADGPGEGDSADGDSANDDANDEANDGANDEANDEDSGDSSSTDLDIDANLELSKKIGTVGILTFTVDGVETDDIEEAWVEFGLEGDLNLRAPVNLEAEKYRTLLLGMKASRDYSARVKLVIDGETHRSGELEVTTGSPPNDLPVINVSGPAGDKLSPGFIVTNTLRGADAVIIDNDGDYVWWYQTDMKISSRARMSYDGHKMWFRDANVMIGDGIIRRVDMDGENEEVMDLPLSHHDLVVLPDDTMAYLVRGENNCDDLVELDPETGDTRTVFKIGQYFDPVNTDAGCHTNSLQYHEADDSYTASLLYNNLYLKFSREGELEWTFGSDDSDFSGVSTWYHQHGHQMWGNHFLMFNNAEAGGSSLAREFEFDFDAMTAKEVWTYDGGLHTAQLGDVQRLDNGNTLVTYSIRGVIHEVDSDGELVQEFAFALGDGLGYVIKRESLYGPAPK